MDFHGWTLSLSDQDSFSPLKRRADSLSWMDSKSVSVTRVVFFLPLTSGVDSHGWTLGEHGGVSPLTSGVDSHGWTLGEQGGVSPLKRGVDSHGWTLGEQGGVSPLRS